MVFIFSRPFYPSSLSDVVFLRLRLLQSRFVVYCTKKIGKRTKEEGKIAPTLDLMATANGLQRTVKTCAKGQSQMQTLT